MVSGARVFRLELNLYRRSDRADAGQSFPAHVDDQALVSLNR